MNWLKQFFSRSRRYSAVTAFAAEQLWYAPRKDFSTENLTPSQREVVRKVDEKILELKAKN